MADPTSSDAKVVAYCAAQGFGDDDVGLPEPASVFTAGIPVETAVTHTEGLAASAVVEGSMAEVRHLAPHHTLSLDPKKQMTITAWPRQESSTNTLAGFQTLQCVTVSPQ